MTASQRRGLITGIVFVGLGVMFLLEAFDVYELAPSILWPVLLLALGVGVLAGIGRDDHDDNDSENPVVR